FEFPQARWVKFEALGVIRKRLLQFAQRAGGLLMSCDQIFRAGINAAQFLEQPADAAGTREQRILAAQDFERTLAQLDQARGMSGALVLPFELRFLLRLEAGGVDFLYLMPQEIELLRVGAFIND